MARTKAASPPTTPTGAEAPFAFEQAMTELEAVVARLEQGDVPLDEALKTFEKGISLSRQCQAALVEAEQTVERLTRKPDGTITTAAFATDSEDDSVE